MNSETLGKLKASKGWIPMSCAVKDLLCLGRGRGQAVELWIWIKPKSHLSGPEDFGGQTHDNGFCDLVWQLLWPGVLRTEDALPTLGRKDLCV